MGVQAHIGVNFWRCSDTGGAAGVYAHAFQYGLRKYRLYCASNALARCLISLVVVRLRDIVRVLRVAIFVAVARLAHVHTAEDYVDLHISNRIPSDPQEGVVLLQQPSTSSVVTCCDGQCSRRWHFGLITTRPSKLTLIRHHNHHPES